MVARWRTVLTEHYADFSGRARRSEFWYFNLVNAIIGFGAYLLMIAALFTSYATATPSDSGETGTLPVLLIVVYGLFVLFGLAILVPQLAVSVRRLPDTGRSGRYLHLSFIPLIGAILLLVWWATESQPGPNRWGPTPKAIGGDVVQHFGATA